MPLVPLVSLFMYDNPFPSNMCAYVLPESQAKCPKLGQPSQTAHMGKSEGVYKQVNQQKTVTKSVSFEHGDQFASVPASHQ
jgi:hypothetical protein